MKYIFFILTMLFSFATFAQQQGEAGGFIHLSKVEKPPFSPDCNLNVPLCTASLLENYIVKNIIHLGSVGNGTSGKTEILAKVVIDTSGQISWASIKGLPAETNQKLVDRLKQMPPFTPGEHEGQKANVIVDLIMSFYIWEAENFSSEAIHFTNTDSPLAWHRCKKADEKIPCTSEAVSNWMNRNINTRKIKQPGFHSLTANFVVGPEGEVNRIVVFGGGDDMGTEVLSTIKKLPKFEPARMGSEAVAAYFTLPITMYRRDL